METNKSPCRLLALAARSNRLPSLDPLVTNRIVLSKPASCSDCAITSASLRLNSYSGTPRALSAPGEVAVWPTSTSTRNADRAQLPLSLPCCVTGLLSARKLPRGASKHHSQCDKSEKATLIDDHRSQLYRCCGFAAQPRLSGIFPRTLYLFACRRTNNMIRPRP